MTENYEGILNRAGSDQYQPVPHTIALEQLAADPEAQAIVALGGAVTTRDYARLRLVMANAERRQAGLHTLAGMKRTWRSVQTSIAALLAEASARLARQDPDFATLALLACIHDLIHGEYDTGMATILRRIQAHPRYREWHTPEKEPQQ